MYTYKIMKQCDEFYLLLGQFLINKEVKKELGTSINSEENYYWVIALNDSNVVGFGAIEINKNVGHLRHSYVVPEYRGNGIYKQIIDTRIKIAIQNNIKIVKTIASPNSINSLKKHGFIELSKNGKYTRMEMNL